MLSTLLLQSSARVSPDAGSRLPPSRSREVRSLGKAALRRLGKTALCRLALSALLLCSFLLSGAQDAHAAPIGMCAETAQSMEAPPPMFPADDAELSPAEECQPSELQFRVQEPGRPGDRLAPSAEMPDEKVILSDLVPVLGARSVPFAFMGQTLSLPEEHRWRGLRPPRD